MTIISSVLQNFPLGNTSLVRRLSKRSFLKNVAILLSGQAIAQGLAVAASPILTRLYDPDAFGSFGLLFSLASTIAVISGLRYELAIVTTKDDEDAARLLILSCGLGILFSGLVAVIPAFAGDFVADLAQRPNFGAVLWWLPVLAMVGGTYQNLNYWLIRKTHYKLIATNRVMQSLASLGLQLAAGLANLGVAGLAGGRLAGSILAMASVTLRIWREDRTVFTSAITCSRIWAVAKSHSNFPKYNAPQNLLNSLSKASVPYTLAPFFGVEIVGFYYLAERVMRTPSALIVGSTRRVYYQRASELHNQGKSFYRLLVKTYVGLGAMGVAPLIVLVFFGPELFSFVFGAQWHKAGVFVQWLSTWWFLSFVASPAVETLTILNRQNVLLYYQIFLSTSRVAAVLVGGLLGDDIIAIAACSVVCAAYNFGLMVFSLIAARPSARPQNLPATE